MGYGSRAIEQVCRYYNGDFVNLSRSEVSEDSDSDDSSTSSSSSSDSDSPSSEFKPRKNAPPLLLPLAETKTQPSLDWIGTSFGMTCPLFKFWSR